MIDKHICKNSENYFGSGLDISVEGMYIIIQEGTFTFLPENLVVNIPHTEIPVEICDKQRFFNLYLVKDANEPLVCIEEIGKGECVTVPNLFATLVSFYIPANCDNLESNELSIQVWHYEEVAPEHYIDKSKQI